MRAIAIVGLMLFASWTAGCAPAPDTEPDAAAAIEVWKPSTAALDCDGSPPCFQELTIVNP